MTYLGSAGLGLILSILKVDLADDEWYFLIFLQKIGFDVRSYFVRKIDKCFETSSFGPSCSKCHQLYKGVKPTFFKFVHM